MTKELITKEQEEKEALAMKIAENSGENTRTYTVMPTITVFNQSSDGADTEFKPGDLIKTIKTQQGYEKEKFSNSFEGIIIKTRMFLKLKYKYAEGKPSIITNEFDSYANSEMISVKEKGLSNDDKYEEVFIGNYKDVHDKYSLKSDTEIERKLDLHHAIYVLTDINTKEVVRIDSKGVSRSNYIDYMNSFSRVGLDRMSTTKTIVGSMISTETYNGKPRKTPIAALKFTKNSELSLEELKKLSEIQTEFEKDLEEKDIMFGNKKVNIVEPDDTTEQPEPVNELPTIQLEDDKPTELPLNAEKDEVAIEDVPFK